MRMTKPREDRASDDNDNDCDRPNTFVQRSLLRRDVFNVFAGAPFVICDAFPPLPVGPGPPFAAWRASHTPIACAHSPGIRRASQPIKVSPAVRVLSGSFGSRSKTEMSLMSRARSVSLATPKNL